MSDSRSTIAQIAGVAFGLSAFTMGWIHLSLGWNATWYSLANLLLIAGLLLSQAYVYLRLRKARR